MNKGKQFYRHIKSSSHNISLNLPVFMFTLMACVLFIGHGSYFKLRKTTQQAASRKLNLLTSGEHVNNANDGTILKRAVYGGKCFQLSWKESSRVHMIEEFIEINNYSGKPERRKINVCRYVVTIYKKQATIGHNMFEVASILGIAYAYDLVPVIHRDYPLMKYFDLPNIVDTNLLTNNKNDVLVCRNCGNYCPFTTINKSTSNITIHGYLQSWKYFENVKEIVRNVFKLTPSKQIKTYFENVTRNGYQHVCIYVRQFRRTQYLNNYKESILISFIQRAKQFYYNKYHKVDLLITTNDKEWCKKTIPGISVSPFENVLDDMVLMTLCDHVIVTSGSIGWWGAWLSNGTIVYWKGYSCSENVVFNPLNNFDYYPPNWIGM